MTLGMRPRPLVVSFVLFALALALPFAIVAITATAWYVMSEQGRLREIVTMVGEGGRDRIDHDLSEMKLLARTLATSPSIDGSDVDAFRSQAIASMGPSPCIAVILVSLDGQRLVDTRPPSGTAAWIDTPSSLIERILAQRQPVVSDLMTSRVTGKPVVWVAAPVIRDGTVVKLVAVVVTAEHLRSLIQLPHLTGPYWSAVYDSSGRLVARSGQGEPRIDTEEEAGGEGNLDPEEILYASQSFARSDWRFVAGVDRNALEAPLAHSLALLLVLALILTGPGSLVALLLARRITQTVAALTAQAEAVGRGEMPQKKNSPIREVHILGNALSDASRALADERVTFQADLKAEAEASRSLYRILAENVSDIVILRRRERPGWIYTSPSFERILGYDEAAQAKLDGAQLIHPEDYAAALAVGSQLGPARPHVQCLFRVRHARGHWVWLETACTFIVGTGPDEPDMLSVLRDVTTRQEQAEELRSARDTAEMARAEAESASRAKSEFLAMVSHEIRTPLATVHGYTELLAESGPLSADQTNHLALISQASGAMLTAVDDILDFARIEVGELDLKDVSFSPAKAAESVLAFARPVAAASGVTVCLALDPTLPALVRGDPRRLRQILLNLVHARLRAQQGGLLTLSLSAVPGAEARIVFALNGTGRPVLGSAPTAGGPKEERSLGTTIARRLVAHLGGRLEIAHGHGEVASYRFSLPFKPANEADAPPSGVTGSAAEPVWDEESTPASPGTLSLGPQGRRVLLVEDHPINQEMTRRILERLGLRVDVVGDGAAAIGLVQQEHYDLVLMDVQMTGMDGLAATRRIRALPHPACDIPIVALTAGILPGQIQAIHDAGMNDTLGKPIDQSKLKAVLRAQLGVLAPAESEAGQAPPA